MSYDLYLIRKERVGDDPAAAYEALEELLDQKPTPEEQRQLFQLAADLQAANPGLDSETNQKSFLIQLGYGRPHPVRIDISSIDNISMSFSYGTSSSDPALAEVALYLPVFKRHGYVAYDPQLNCLFDPMRDSAAAAGVYQCTSEKLPEIVRQLAPKKSWWKKLFGSR